MTSLRSAVRASVTFLALLTLAACGDDNAGDGDQGAAPSEVIKGAGATFPQPLYAAWIDHYRELEPDVEFIYEGLGSGEGIKLFISEQVDYGASDAAMSDAEIDEVERGVKLVPMTAGMVVLAYNVAGIDGDLKLPREVLVDIFLDRIYRWDNPRIAAANPDLDLPSKLIQPVVRRDSSGTTFVFSNHLSNISEAWKDGPGTGKTLDWPGHAMTGEGNAGVAQKVKVSQGSIGYMEYSFAKRLGIPIALIENKAGNFVKPDDTSGRAAIASAATDNLPEDLRLFLPDPPGRESYPMVSLTWLLLYGSYPDGAKAAALKEALTWNLTKGQRIAGEMGYIPLPDEIVAKATAAVESIN